MRPTQAAAAVLGVWMTFGIVAARGADIGSPVPMPEVGPFDIHDALQKWADGRKSPIIKGAAVREEDGDHPRQAVVKAAPQYTPAGTTKLIDGYFYTADGAGTWKFCESCNGCTFEQALAKYNAAARVVPQPPFTPGLPLSQSPPSRPGFPTNPGTPAASAGRVSFASPGSMQMGATRMFASGAVIRGGTSSDCATGGG